MKWSYILFLSAFVSAFWGVAPIVSKKSLTPAQFVLCFMQLTVAFAVTMLAIFFRGRAGTLSIYDFLFRLSSMFCVPLYYIGICTLTQPRGATLRQRRVILLPIIYMIVFTAGMLVLGPARYEQLCEAVCEGDDVFLHGDNAWNFMLLCDHWAYLILLVAVNFPLMLTAHRKAREYQLRFNSYYAQGLNVPFIDSRVLVILTWLFLPLGILTILMIDFRPYYYKYWIIGTTVILTVLQFFIGRFVYRLDYDARSLADYIRKNHELE